MLCKVGYWRNGLSVQLCEDAYNAVKLQGPRMSVQVQADRRLLIVGSLKGRKIDSNLSLPYSRKSPGMFGGSTELTGEALDTVMAGPDFVLPLFELMSIGIRYDFGLDGLLTDPLPGNHELPWPRTQTRRYPLNLEDTKRECAIRIKSHMLRGGSGYFDEVGVPVEVVKALGGVYRAVLDKCRSEVPRMAA